MCVDGFKSLQLHELEAGPASYAVQCWQLPSGSSLTLLSMNFWPQLPKSCIWAQVNWALVLPTPAVHV